MNIDTETIEDRFDDLDNSLHIGGYEDSTNTPNGGFLPIYPCEKKDKTEKKSENREFKPVKNSISIQQILKLRREKPHGS
jgi:hypothetical protein